MFEDNPLTELGDEFLMYWGEAAANKDGAMGFLAFLDFLKLKLNQSVIQPWYKEFTFDPEDAQTPLTFLSDVEVGPTRRATLSWWTGNVISPSSYGNNMAEVVFRSTDNNTDHLLFDPIFYATKQKANGPIELGTNSPTFVFHQMDLVVASAGKGMNVLGDENEPGADDIQFRAWGWLLPV